MRKGGKGVGEEERRQEKVEERRSYKDRRAKGRGRKRREADD